MKIGIDIDGVLNDLYYFNKSYGSLFCSQQQWPIAFNENEYKLRDMYNLTYLQEREFYKTYYSIFLESSNFVRPYAAKALQNLHKFHEIILITARKDSDIFWRDGKCMEDITRDWLNKNKLEFDLLIFSAQDKKDAIYDNNIHIIIEDSPLFFSTADFSIPMFCFDEKYNRDISGKNIYRAYNWFQIENLIEQLNV